MAKDFSDHFICPSRGRRSSLWKSPNRTRIKLLSSHSTYQIHHTKYQIHHIIQILNTKYIVANIRPGHKPIIQLAVMGASCKSTADNIQGQRDFKILPHVGQINLKQSLHDGQINISNKQRSISLNLQAQILKLPD